MGVASHSVPSRIAIMSAIPGELKMLRSRPAASGATLVESGIGKVNAAVVTTRLILEHRLHSE